TPPPRPRERGSRCRRRPAERRRTRSTPARSAPLPRLHPLDLGTEEPRAEPAEGREVAARDKHPAGRLASRTARVAGAAEERARLECGLVRARDEDHAAAHD